jgi:hypothetical protein
MIKIWNNFREWFFYKTISRNTKLAILKMAKMICEKHPEYGMCTSILITSEILLSRAAYTISLPKLLPQFNREYLGGNALYGLYWWDPKDRESRLKAFDKLIELYTK